MPVKDCRHEVQSTASLVVETISPSHGAGLHPDLCLCQCLEGVTVIKESPGLGGYLP